MFAEVKWKNVLIVGFLLLLLIMLFQGDKAQERKDGGWSFLPQFDSAHRDAYTLVSWAMLLAAVLVIVKLITQGRR